MPLRRRGVLAGFTAVPVAAAGRPPADPVRVAQTVNATVGLLAGDYGSTDLRIAADIARITGDGDRLRVLPILGAGSIQNAADLIFARGIDLAILHEDAIAWTIRGDIIPREDSLQYICRLFSEEIHILARPHIARMADLNGQIVSVGPAGGGTELTASTLMRLSGVTPIVANDTLFAGLDRLIAGTVSAVVVVGGAPVPILRMIEPGTGLHFLTVPLTSDVVSTYTPASLEPRHYPNLSWSGPPVETVATGSVLATLTAAADTQRAKRVNRFTGTFFQRFAQLRQAGCHPKWREVSLGADLPNWHRYPEAETLLSKPQNPDKALRGAFDSYLNGRGQSEKGMDAKRREALFRDFLKWRNDHVTR